MVERRRRRRRRKSGVGRRMGEGISPLRSSRPLCSESNIAAARALQIWSNLTPTSEAAAVEANLTWKDGIAGKKATAAAVASFEADSDKIIMLK